MHCSGFKISTSCLSHSFSFLSEGFGSERCISQGRPRGAAPGRQAPEPQVHRKGRCPRGAGSVGSLGGMAEVAGSCRSVGDVE